ncbi:MAG: PH domain-containing protein [Nocardioides sp.]|nr:PH domain-containing protein [Nocardioides sp.]
MSDPVRAAVPLPSLPTLPHTWRPLGPRVMGIALAVALTAACVGAAIALGPETRAKFTTFQRGTLIASALGYGAVLYALLRSRVTASPEGLVVVNGYRRHELVWAQVVEVNLMRGAPWVTLDLADGTSMSVLGIQGSDGDRARLAARQLRAFVLRANA